MICCQSRLFLKIPFFRVFLYKDWCGMRDDELSKVSGIAGSIFCHATGFIGGNKTKKGAVEMALRSIDANGK